jgi:hypothetical protein
MQPRLRHSRQNFRMDFAECGGTDPPGCAAIRSAASITPSPGLSQFARTLRSSWTTRFAHVATHPMLHQHALSESRDASCWQHWACSIMSSCSACTRLCLPWRTFLMADGADLRVDGPVVSESSMTGVGLCPTANMACSCCGHHSNTFCQACLPRRRNFLQEAILLLGQLPSPIVAKPKTLSSTPVGARVCVGGVKTKLQGVPQWACIEKKHEREGGGEGPGAVMLKG